MTGIDISDLPRCAVGIFGHEDPCGGLATRVTDSVERQLRGRNVAIHPVRCVSCGTTSFLVAEDGQVVHQVGSFFGESAEATAVLEDIYERHDESIIGVARYLGMKEKPVARMLERYGIHEPTPSAAKILEEADPDDWPKQSRDSRKPPSGTQLVTDGGGLDGR